MIIVSKNSDPDRVFAIHLASQDAEISSLYSASDYTMHKYNSIEYLGTDTIKDRDGNDVEVDTVKVLVVGDIFTDKGLTAAFPVEISKRQFYQQLAVEGLITEAEALTVIQSGVLPAAMEAFILQLPSDMQFSTRMLLAGAQTFERGHAMSQALEAHMDFTEAQVDQIWVDASKL